MDHGYNMIAGVYLSDCSLFKSIGLSFRLLWVVISHMSQQLIEPTNPGAT